MDLFLFIDNLKSLKFVFVFVSFQVDDSLSQTLRC